MNRVLVMGCVAVLSALAWAGPTTLPSGAGKDFGDPMSAETIVPTDLATVLAAPEKFEGKNLRIVGRVAEVCQPKGCWIQLADDADRRLQVKFTCPIDGRLIPLEAVGKPVMVEGQLKIKMLDEAEARHYAEDAGKPKSEIEKIKGPQKQVSLASPSARLWLD